MRRIALTLIGLALAFTPGLATRAYGFCSVAEGCSPCPPPHITVDKQGVHIVWIYC